MIARVGQPIPVDRDRLTRGMGTPLVASCDERSRCCSDAHFHDLVEYYLTRDLLSHPMASRNALRTTPAREGISNWRYRRNHRQRIAMCRRGERTPSTVDRNSLARRAP